jgi:flagellar basal body-associated protein FliL
MNETKLHPLARQAIADVIENRMLDGELSIINTLAKKCEELETDKAKEELAIEIKIIIEEALDLSLDKN